MKIGFDVSDLATNRADGTTRYTAELAKRLPLLASEHQWEFYAPSVPRYPISDIRYQRNVQLHVSPWPKYWTQSRFPVDLYRHRPDVLFMPIQQLPFVRPGRMKTIAVVHDLAFHFYPQQFTYKDWLLQHIFTSYAVQEADRVICVSQATADDVARVYGRDKDVSVVHHGVDQTHFYPLESEEETAAAWQKLRGVYPGLRPEYILFVGQIQPRKNLIRLIEAFEVLAQREPDLQLVIAGGHGWLQEPILKRMRGSQYTERILQLGVVSNELLPALYRHAGVFVLPSLYEGFGMPVLEAMACGCPVVTSNISSLPEVAGKAAVLIDPLEVGSLVSGIQEAREKTVLLRASGLAQAKQFTWEATARQTLEVITE